MRIPKRVTLVGATFLTLVAVLATAMFIHSGGNAHAASKNGPAVLDDSKLHATTTILGGATILPTTRTVAHWFGQTLDPNNGVTYGYNMVGADPNTCTGSACCDGAG